MNKSEYISAAQNLFEETAEVLAYWDILQQFRRNVDEYNDEMQCSVAFYNIVYQALGQSLFMGLAKLYDWNLDSITIRNLVDRISIITEQNLDDGVRKNYNAAKNKFRHMLSPEEVLFGKEVQEKKRMNNRLGYKYRGTTVELSLAELKKLYVDRFEILKEQKLIRNLIKQRNKIHAHNDAVINFNFKSVLDSFPLKDQDIKKLIDYAVEFLGAVLELLTGVYTVPRYVNVDDWQETLRLVRLGMNN